MCFFRDRDKGVQALALMEKQRARLACLRCWGHCLMGAANRVGHCEEFPRHGTESRHGLDTNHPPSVDIFKEAKEKPCHGGGGWSHLYGGY